MNVDTSIQEHSGYQIYKDKDKEDSGVFRSRRRPRTDSEIRLTERRKQEQKERGESISEYHAMSHLLNVAVGAVIYR